MSKIENTVESIHSHELTSVVGGADDKAGYNMQDVKNAATGAQAGARVAGPVGAVVGGGAGFMSRNVGNLFGAAKDYWNESRRGAQLDAQLKAIQKK